MNAGIKAKACARKAIGAFTGLQISMDHRTLNLDEASALRTLRDARAERDLRITCDHVMDPVFDLMIVIPAYNVKEYIQICLDSVLNQKTDYSFHVVVTDDGSTDGTGEILDSYLADKRVAVIHQPNGGIARARNAALKTITGRYLMFVDSDDLLYPGAVQSLLKKAYDLDADIVEGGRRLFTEDPEAGETVRYEDTFKDTDFSEHHGGPWAKVIRSSLFWHLSFPEDYEFEDSIMGYCVFPEARKKYTVSDIVYGCRIRPDSITRTAEGSSKSVDTVYLSIFLTEWRAAHSGISKELQIQVIRQMLLNHTRTASQGEEIQKCGFCLQRMHYVALFGGGGIMTSLCGTD